MKRKKVVNLDIKYGTANKIKDVTVDERGGVFLFTKDFLYLGSNIDFLINNMTAIRNRISKAYKAIEALKFI